MNKNKKKSKDDIDNQEKVEYQSAFSQFRIYRNHQEQETPLNYLLPVFVGPV